MATTTGDPWGYWESQPLEKAVEANRQYERDREFLWKARTPSRRWKRCMLDKREFSVLFERILCWGTKFRVIPDLPADVRYVRHYYDPQQDCIWAIFESETFEPVEEGAEIPQGPPLRVEVVGD